MRQWILLLCKGFISMFAKAQQTDYDFFDVTGICVYYRKKLFC